MRCKENSAYMMSYGMKFENTEEAERDLKRWKMFCYRLQKKQEEEVHFVIGMSTISSASIGVQGEMGYDKPKNQGGIKQYIPYEMKQRNRKTGEVKIVRQGIPVKPHIHILVYGYGASSCAQSILENMRKRDSNNSYLKHSKDYVPAADLSQKIDYIETQSTKLFRV
ncbi:hypothetical protein SDC9_59049 [bioreactor metagenome]|uniref:Uncharacterized protein n=1 Tax=bioreactor metagenome TaxID=1076179 RepID=A0A644X943_9ZZZZ